MTKTRNWKILSVQIFFKIEKRIVLDYNLVMHLENI